MCSAVLALASCSAPVAEPRPEQTSTIVSLNPCLDAILVGVSGLEQRVVLSHYSHDPAASSIPQEVALEYGATGGTVEEVLALDPDLVLASAFIAPATAKALDDLDVPVASFGIAGTLEDDLALTQSVAEAVGNPQLGLALTQSIREAVARNRPEEGARTISTVLWQSGEIVPGNATLIAELMRTMGFASHSEALGLSQADRLPLEVLLANPPDLVLVAGDSAGQSHPMLGQLPGTRVERFDPKLFYCGGPSVIGAVERLAEIRRGFE